ncbi:MAG: HDOD domain-containing protein [Candidatus Neomarinimicrobiota bacterium]
MQRLIARQPVFTSNEKLFAHELNFGFNPDELFTDPESRKQLPDDIATAMFASAAKPGARKRRVILEITPNMLIDDSIQDFSRKTAILRLSEPFEPTEAHKTALAKLKADGFRFALGAFALESDLQEIAAHADMIVVDFTIENQADLRLIPLWCAPLGIKTLAHNVTTREAFELAKSQQYDFFHGSFFYEAKIVEKDEIKGFKLNYLRLLQEINRGDISYTRLDEIIKQDVSLTFKLLKYINSAAFGLRSEIESIKHALALLGTRQVKKWASMVSLTNMGQDLPEEALVTCVLRGRFLEELGGRLGHRNRGDDLFFMGIFSMIDLFFGRPKEEVLAELPLKDDIKSAILGGEGPFRNLLNAVLSYEDGDWDPLHSHLSTLGMPEEHVPDIYFEALDWTQNIFLSNLPTA